MDSGEKKWAAAVLGRADSADVEAHRRSEEATLMIERKPLADKVKEELGLGALDKADGAQCCTPVQIGVALVRMSESIDRLHDYGCGMHAATCGRIGKLEGWRTMILGGSAFLGAAAAVIAFALLIAPHIH
jgi:hypothetical protein